MEENFDVIIIGAGSVGVPTAMELAKEKLKVLVVDKYHSVGQGQNKAAIGGIRATHSDKSKIKTGLRSIDIFSKWTENYCDEINWHKGGYLFPVYNKDDKTALTDILKTQKNFGLNIEWIDAYEVTHLVRGISDEHLLGAIYSPDDGNASPLLSINAFYRQSKKLGVKFKFNENVTEIKIKNGKVTGVKTDKSDYNARFVINAAGAFAGEIGKLAGVNLPVVADMHEAGITEPVERMFEPMIVDVRPVENSKNYYFYQNSEGQLVFCMTPQPALIGTNRDCTSEFLPLVSKRMIGLMPKLSKIKVRRVWRGLYPMTPDGFPIVDSFKEVEGFVSAVGMCGQGFMLGPGIGELLAKLITGKLTKEDKEVLEGFSARRSFGSVEVFK